MFVYARSSAARKAAVRMLAHVGEVNPYDWTNRGPLTIGDVYDAIAERFGASAGLYIEVTYH